MWRALTHASSIQEAYQRLLAEYDVEPGVLRQDLEELIGKLEEQGLVRISD